MTLAHEMPPRAAMLPRHDWTRAEVRALFALPFPELLFQAATVHRQHFDPAEVAHAGGDEGRETGDDANKFHMEFGRAKLICCCLVSDGTC